MSPFNAAVGRWRGGRGGGTDVQAKLELRVSHTLHVSPRQFHVQSPREVLKTRMRNVQSPFYVCQIPFVVVVALLVNKEERKQSLGISKKKEHHKVSP